MVLGTVLTGACEDPPAPARAPAGPRGKRELYGDPALVPTRAGERARAELALADAVRAALAALGAGELAVEVRLPAGPDPGAVVVTGQAPPGRREAELRRLIADLCGPWSEPVIRLVFREGAAGPGAPASGQGRGDRGDFALYLALLGLGASAGITLDRLRRRVRGLGYTWPR